MSICMSVLPLVAGITVTSSAKGCPRGHTLGWLGTVRFAWEAPGRAHCEYNE